MSTLAGAVQSGALTAALSGSTNDLVIYRPKDAARVLGINEDSVTRHIKQRPSLFPQSKRRSHQWSPEQFDQVLRALRSLSYKARPK